MNKEILKAALRGMPTANFAANEVNAAANKDFDAEFGIVPGVTTRRELRNKLPAMFDLLAETIDEILPKDVSDIMGMYAEEKTFGLQDEVIFRLRTGGKRAALSIKRGAKHGIYRAARRDSKIMKLETDTWTVGVFLELEDILLGRYSFNDLYKDIINGFEQKIYAETVVALRQAVTLAPASHFKTNDGESLETDLDELVRIAKAYGDDVIILGFSSELSKLQNLKDWAVKEDRADVRTQGFIREYKGIQVHELPNYILQDGATAQWAFKENQIFVLPAGIKPVKIAFVGDTLINEDKQPTGSTNYNIEHEMGIGLLLTDNVCILEDSSNKVAGQY